MTGTAYQRRSGIIARQVAGSTVLVALGTRTDNMRTRAAELYTLNKTGMIIWDLLGTPQTEAALASRLAETFRIGGDQARADVQAFLGELVEIGAVEQRASE